ncbi:family 43 glycosylhydrolase [Chryseosolibacter indicus]|uniref:Glycoside hydrolase family 43 protein n=1 Tax=Chryseosolibacter indicus TaxID=2782351 RepID=A0ABS5VRF0_9BACT|nr:family 43 glycosylhydrolase [Chryseosolibacter indicus]MBT1703598.1 glycoside hydrolase family 43 protein [Chryseosolibacter indicus]
MIKFVLQLTLLLTSLNSFSQILVLPGDNPDPSVVKIGDKYYASATTSNWAPAFPIYESKDLKTWHPKGHVFAQLPKWSDYYFWAPEISYDNGKVWVYYAAHKGNGNLCVGVASADKPEGPYTDHGTLICEEAGSIDAFQMRDENGKLYLIWKEDANSVNKPTPIWAMEMSEDRSKLIGEKVKLFYNDVAWEANVVEGVSMIRHGGYYYAFYAGAGCCARGCNYGMGVARAKNLLGPWEKYNKNPLLKTGARWKCPGHGTPIEHEGKYYFLYHAYEPKADVYAGRQGILSEFTFTEDGWIEFKVDEETTSGIIPSEIKDDFNGNNISPYWQWSVFKNPEHKLTKGKLTLQGDPEISGAFLGLRTYTANYEATATVLIKESSSETGMGLIGDRRNLASITIKEGKLIVKKIDAGKETIINTIKAKGLKDNITLRASVKGGQYVTFEYSLDGKTFTKAHKEPVDGYFIPPWDSAVRVGVIAKGNKTDSGVFDQFKLVNHKE